MELDWLKKVRVRPAVTRRTWIGEDKVIPVIRQRELAGVSRATVYAKRTPQVVAARDLLHCRLIDEQYTRRPFYGS